LQRHQLLKELCWGDLEKWPTAAGQRGGENLEDKERDTGSDKRLARDVQKLPNEKNVTFQAREKKGEEKRKTRERRLIRENAGAAAGEP